MGAIESLADGGVVQIRHDRDVAWRLQSKAPAGLPFGFGRGSGGRDRRRRKAFQTLLFCNQKFKGIGRVQNIFGEFRSGFRQRHVDFLKPGFARGIQLRAMTLEGIDGFGEKALHGPRQRMGLVRGGIALNRLPQILVQRDAGIERADFRLHRVIGGA